MGGMPARTVPCSHEPSSMEKVSAGRHGVREDATEERRDS